MSRVVIIGGGAAGLCCAGFCAQQGLQTIVLEKNARAGRKLMITGKGRCNLTNNCTPELFLQNVRSNPRFLYSASEAFTCADTIALFEKLGVPVKTERGGRVFPISDKAMDVVDALTRFAKENGARISYHTHAVAILQKESRVTGVKLDDGETIDANAVVIATGGLSCPLTGSNGDGYRLAAQLGHQIVTPRASLVPILTKEKWCAQLMGLSLKNVTLTLKNNKGKPLFSELGEMLFTHFGISGPLVLSASSYMTDTAADYRIEIDLKPALDAQQLDTRLLRDFSEQKNRDFINALDKLLPRKLIPVVVQLSQIPPETKVNAITREQRRHLVALLKALPLTPVGFRPIDEAVITAGGISVKEVNPKTMQSKLVNGLFFAGEVLDVDAFTGGYNLQIAWSTAYLAALGAAACKD